MRSDSPQDGVVVQGDVLSRLHLGHPGVILLVGLGRDVLKVTLHGQRSTLVGDRPAPRHDGLYIHVDHSLASSNPVLDGPGPQDAMALDERDVAGE
jgi:hypothetical protein